MTMYMIVFGELVRAYGARSMRLSLFQIGVFSNPWIQPAVFSAVALTFFVGHVPGVRDVFDMQFLTGREYAFCLGLCPLPLVVDEITKTVYRRIGYGVRPKSRMLEQRPSRRSCSARAASRATSTRCRSSPTSTASSTNRDWLLSAVLSPN
jgi:hypothetical protein